MDTRTLFTITLCAALAQACASDAHESLSVEEPNETDQVADVFTDEANDGESAQDESTEESDENQADELEAEDMEENAPRANVRLSPEKPRSAAWTRPEQLEFELDVYPYELSELRALRAAKRTLKAPSQPR